MLTIGIIIITAIISIMAFNNQDIFDRLCLYPYTIHNDKKGYYRLFTVAFVHADYSHLLLNMITLYFFGKGLEESVFTETQFLLFYLSATVLSCLVEYGKQKENPAYKACGASGAVSAVLFSLVLFEPWGIVYIKFIIPVYFILFAVGYLIYSYYMSKKANERIGHGIHLWGALYGIAFTLIIKPDSLHGFLEMVTNPPFLK